MTRLDEQARLHVEHYPEELAMTTFGPLGDYGLEVVSGTLETYNDNGPLVAAATRKGDYISTFTGRFWPMDPRSYEVRIEDIAHSLAMQCRYAGHGRRFYSVAEHSVRIARWLSLREPVVALCGLLHDATEAYLVDVPRPVKKHLAGYKDAERQIWIEIAERFDLPWELPAIVHEADSRIIADEMYQNLWEVDPSYNNPLGITLEFWSPETAELYFMDTFKRLIAARDAENMRGAA